MRYQPYSHEALKKLVAGALGPAHLDLTRLMGEAPLNEEERTNPDAIPRKLHVNRMALVAALGFGIRPGGIFSRQEVLTLQARAASGSGPALDALKAMQATRPIDRTKTLGVLLWRIKYGGDQGPEVFLAAAHILAGELRRKNFAKGKLGHTYVAVMQCALTEWLHDRCQACHGTAQTGRQKDRVGRNHPALYTCGDCGGTGAYSPGAQQRAQALKMDVETFMKKWESRYDRVLAMLQKVDRTTGNSIDRQVRHAYASSTDRSPEQ